MKKKIVFFIALFAMSALINAASRSEKSSSAAAQQNPMTCQQTCSLHWQVYCVYGGWGDYAYCNAQYNQCVAGCPQ